MTPERRAVIVMDQFRRDTAAHGEIPYLLHLQEEIAKAIRDGQTEMYEVIIRAVRVVYAGPSEAGREIVRAIRVDSPELREALIRTVQEIQALQKTLTGLEPTT